MDWVRLLEDNKIEYVTRGPNTKRGEVSIKCPWCGEDDPSQHLGINLLAESWGCLRNARHRGYSSAYLIATLLRVSIHQAKIIRKQYEVSDPDSLLDATKLFSDDDDAGDAVAEPTSPTTLPNDFRYIEDEGLTRPYFQYLIRRGFPKPGSLIRYFGLRAALLGRFKGRLIIPVWGGPRKTALIGWTGRAIGKVIDAPRYKESGPELKATVLNFDNLRRDGGKLLTVVEGPIDALKLDYFGVKLEARATCLFGANMTPAQAGALNELCRRFDRVNLMLDPDAVQQAFDARDWLIAPNVSFTPVPEGAEDPGAMNGFQVVNYVREMLPRFPRVRR